MFPYDVIGQGAKKDFAGEMAVLNCSVKRYKYFAKYMYMLILNMDILTKFTQ